MLTRPQVKESGDERSLVDPMVHGMATPDPLPAVSASPSPSRGRREAYVTVSPTYSRVSETFRRLSTSSVQCSLFCGGTRCKYERGERWGEGDKALRGLYSHWVTPDILAMARPSTRMIRGEGLVDQFKQVGIATIVNLQLPWEHSKCGPGMESSGFTYQPEDAMRHGVYFYNYGWMDYGVPTLESVLDMVKVLDFALQEGKVAIHCHAGLGRTGVLIACYLVYSQRLTGDEAITFVREKRPGSIQTRPQIEIVQQFDLSLRPLWPFFPTSSLTFDEHLRHQTLLLHGLELQRLRHTPKAVHAVCKALLRVYTGKLLQGNGPITSECPDDITDPARDVRSELVRAFLNDTRSETLCDRASAIQSEMNTSRQWRLLEAESDPTLLFSLLLLFFQQLKEPFLAADTDLVAPSGKPSIDTLPLGKCLTLKHVVDTLKEVSTQETLTCGHGHSLASRLAQALLQAPPTPRDSNHVTSTIALITRYWAA